MSVKDSTPHPELLAAATVDMLTTPPRRKRLDLVREHGSFCAALSRIPHSASAAGTAKRVLEEICKAGLEALCMTDPLYPRLLRAAPDPPPVISVWGRLEPDDALALAIVGSRRATRYGLEMSRRLAAALSSAGLTIVSGLARGIDAAAHRGALDACGRTVAVLGSGLGNIYPREHQKLAEQISRNGAVISEFDVNEPPRGRNFPRRNRIITGMTLGTLVVEAALKSGSLVSARLAMEQDREVFAVPGPALSPNSQGRPRPDSRRRQACHRSLRRRRRAETRHPRPTIDETPNRDDERRRARRARARNPRPPHERAKRCRHRHLARAGRHSNPTRPRGTERARSKRKNLEPGRRIVSSEAVTRIHRSVTAEH